MPYKECQICGAHLDYGERCDCEKVKEKEKELTLSAKTDASSNVKCINIITH